MRASELRDRDAEELKREMGQLQKQLFQLRFKWQAQENPDASQRHKLKKDIARYKTVLHEMGKGQ